jgi:RNA ligase (TIGR02306 family)
MKLASIETITEILPHGNADSLLICRVLGYQCIIRKVDDFKVGDKVCFIQPDTVLPDAEWATVFKTKSNRTKAIRLRGEWSEGIVLPLTTFFEQNKNVFLDGYEVSELIGVTKYNPPAPQDLNAKGPLPFGIPKTDEERFNNIENLPFGELVDVTLKVDGCLDGSTKIATENGLLSIEDIVNENMIGLKVSSFNNQTNEIEYVPILSVSGKENTTDKVWYEIELTDGTILKLTENHQVYLPVLGCYRRADNLKEDDVVLLRC